MANDRAKRQRTNESDDIMHGRSLAGAEYGANEREQTDERNRVARGGARMDEIGEVEVTDAEIEAREENSESGDSDTGSEGTSGRDRDNR